MIVVPIRVSLARYKQYSAPGIIFVEVCVNQFVTFSASSMIFVYCWVRRIVRRRVNMLLVGQVQMLMYGT